MNTSSVPRFSKSSAPLMSGLSGNDMYCLHLKGLRPGELLVGNSMHSLGFLGGLRAMARTIAGAR